MNLWRRLSGMTINHSEPSTSLVAQIRDLYTKLKALNGLLCSDVVFGFFFQSAVMQSLAPIKKDFEQRVENQVQNDAAKAFPKFEAIVHNYKICQQQWSEQSPQPTDVVGTQMPSVMQASTTNEDFDFNTFLAEIPEDNWSEALEFFAVTARRCWQCKAPDHYLRDCPQQSKGAQPTGVSCGSGGNPINGNSQRQMATFVGSLYTQQGGHQGLGRSQPAPPSQFQTQAKWMADFYRPRYQQSQSRQQSTSTQQQQSQKGGASAQVIELGGVPDDLDDLDFRAMTLGEDIVSPTVIFDTGASHHFSGSRSLLHNFRTLSKPLPLSVATAANQSYITGVGDLKFHVNDRSIIVIKGVLYCEQARSNLISMAALRKSNASVLYDNDRDAFKIFNSLGNHAFSCILDKSRNRWCLPYNFLRNNISKSCGDVSVLLSSTVNKLPFSNQSLSTHVSLPLNSVSSPSVSNDSTGNQIYPLMSDMIPSQPNLNAATTKFSGENFFKAPIAKIDNFQWRPETLSKDEKQLLFWYRVFGHVGLRVLRKLIKENLGEGLPNSLPHGSIHCPVCAISKSTALNTLTSTKREIKRMEILAVDLIGPFEVEAVDGSKYLLTLRDSASGYCFVKPIKAK
jgi:hypothetical protein